MLSCLLAGAAAAPHSMVSQAGERMALAVSEDKA